MNLIAYGAGLLSSAQELRVIKVLNWFDNFFFVLHLISFNFVVQEWFFFYLLKLYLIYLMKHCLTDSAEKKTFDPSEACKEKIEPSKIQPYYFVEDSFDIVKEKMRLYLLFIVKWKLINKIYNTLRSM